MSHNRWVMLPVALQVSVHVGLLFAGLVVF